MEMNKGLLDIGILLLLSGVILGGLFLLLRLRHGVGEAVRKCLWAILVLVIVFLLSGVGTTLAAFNDPETSSSNPIQVITNWYNLAWGYRKPITITNGGSALTSFQLNLTVATQTLITAGKINSAGNDIIFTNAGNTSLPYWIESGVNTTTTSIW